MAKRGIRVKDGENLSDSNKERVISLLESENPITKKEACEMLNISYNTTRLNNILQEYKDGIAFIKQQRKAVRGTPVSEADILYIIQEYLVGEPLSSISDATFRSNVVIKNILKRFNIPLRDAKNNYFNPPMLEDDSISDDYVRGDLVYSAKYDTVAYIKGLAQNSKEHGNVYSVWLLGDNCQSAVQPYYELADLRKIQKMGVKIPEMDSNDIKIAVNEAVRNSNKRAKNDK